MNDGSRVIAFGHRRMLVSNEAMGPAQKRKHAEPGVGNGRSFICPADEGLQE